MVNKPRGPARGSFYSRLFLLASHSPMQLTSCEAFSSDPHPLMDHFGACMKFEALFQPLQVGPYKLAHRVAMAPLTRMRAERESFAPRPLNAEYYGQRATQGGLIIAEASPVLSHGRGNPATPGIYSETQIAGWRKVVDAVHAKGGI